MKKIFLLVIYALSYHLYHSQEQSQNTGVAQPTPTAASLSTYNNIPVSVQTGIPDISYPLVSVPTNNKFLNISLGLNYHAGNVDDGSWVSNVGKGWSLLGSGVISREIIGDFDESFDDVNGLNYHKNEYDDVYNFSIPEESGKFRIIRDIVNNTYKIVQLSPYTSKITYNPVNNPATLIIDSFTITSSKGLIYRFEAYDINQMEVWRRDNMYTESLYSLMKYRSAFYLTSVSDDNNQELVHYFYVKDLVYPPATTASPSTETNKLTRIEIKDRGIIEINTRKDDLGYSLKNDPFKVDDITLKTYDNRFVKRFTFQYSYPLPTSFRTLDSFRQVDSSGNIMEKYGFNYTTIFAGQSEQYQISSTLLRRIQLPTNGAIEYNYELVPYTYRREIIKVGPPTEPFGNAMTFNQLSPYTKKYFFTVTDPSEIIIDATSLANLYDHTWALQFYKKAGNNYYVYNAIGPAVDPDPGYELSQTRTFDPGEYYVSLFTNDFSFPLTDAVTFEARRITGPATERPIFIPVKGLPRLKNIKHFDLDFSAIQNFSTPVKVENYEYAKFDHPSESSGFLVEGGSLDGGTMLSPVFIYKNVKVSQGSGIGYTRYYFKAPDSYPIQAGTDGVWPYFNLTRGGLLDKKEVYNSSDQKVQEDIFTYTFEEYDSPKYLVAPVYNGVNFYLKTAWVKNQSSISRNYFDSGMAEVKKEVTRNPLHYNVSLEKTTLFDGSIQETSYLYPIDKNNDKLLTANMTSIPLETKTIIRKNASDAEKLMSKSETKYDNPANRLPSSAVSYDSQNTLASEVVFNLYDGKGNLEQYTSRDDIPVSVVWGYKKTQPIAKIEGASYDQIAPYVADIIAKSDAQVVSEQDLQNALDLFRNHTNLKSFQITTYGYDSLFRMKSMTPPSGIREVYKYDSFGRLERLEDEAGKLLKKYQYNYKH
ncbi:hypothetical protein [Chryseobacterium carnipullorum]|uniref:hypothetical protein n=1 Tax=Chryseobacterium carnipullorum TaxID=1124835 RepID=UPI000E8E4CB9|nr:hypothetical protein [Chryseobacterium carnipullorum]HBV17989.1 hypothetical protein [Chryseobacterium carnipullorum]